MVIFRMKARQPGNIFTKIITITTNFHKNIPSIQILDQYAFIREFQELCDKLEYLILNSDLLSHEQNIPLVAIACLKESIKYWHKVYKDVIEGHAWCEYITVTQAVALGDLDWRGVFVRTIQGAVIGSVWGSC